MFKILNLSTGSFWNDWSEDYVNEVPYEFFTREQAQKQIDRCRDFNLRPEHLEIIEIGGTRWHIK
jgi:hypothetical protein